MSVFVETKVARTCADSCKSEGCNGARSIAVIGIAAPLNAKITIAIGVVNSGLRAGTYITLIILAKQADNRCVFGIGSLKRIQSKQRAVKIDAEQHNITDEVSVAQLYSNLIALLHRGNGAAFRYGNRYA